MGSRTAHAVDFIKSHRCESRSVCGPNLFLAWNRRALIRSQFDAICFVADHRGTRITRAERKRCAESQAQTISDPNFPSLVGLEGNIESGVPGFWNAYVRHNAMYSESGLTSFT